MRKKTPSFNLDRLFFQCVLPVSAVIFAGEFLVSYYLAGHPLGHLGWAWTSFFVACLTVPTVYLLLFMPLARQFHVREEIETLLRHNEAETRNLVNALEEAVVRIDMEGVCTFANEGAAKVLGYPCPDLIIGRTLCSEMVRDPEGEFLSPDQCQFTQKISNGEPFTVEGMTLYRKDNSSFPADFRAYPIIEEGVVVGATAIFSDISDRLSRDEKIRQLAFCDTLTGLPNRETLHDRLNQAIAAADRKDHKVAVFFLDLDRFKSVNDILGHDVGDQLLKQVAARLVDCVRKSDTVARFGGDEFVIMLPFIRDAKDIARVARKVMAAFEQPFVIDGKEVRTATSIGIAMFPDNGKHISVLLKHADAAMYHAKSLGRQNFQFFSREISEQIEKKIELEQALRLALQDNEFEMVYQPQIATSSGKICGVEALLRWRHPDKGVISPGEFIAVAEESGLIVPIGDRILLDVCRQLRKWQDAGMVDIRVAVNISGHQFKHPDFLPSVQAILQQTGVDPAGLEMEITESTLMNIRGDITGLLSKIRDLGVSLSIDDFGTGYSSLSYLKHFPIGKIKIDRSFVRDVPQDSNDSAIVETIIAMSHALGIKTVAEGVETGEQLEFLCNLKCDEIQGYFFTPPMATGDLERFIADWETTRSKEVDKHQSDEQPSRKLRVLKTG